MLFKRSDWTAPLALVALSLVPCVGGVARLAELAGGAAITPQNARFFAAPLPVVLHIVSVVLFSLIGAFQFSAGLRRRFRSWHRGAGRILLATGLTSALSGLWMAQWYPWPAGDGWAVYLERMVFGVAMLVCLLFSIDAIRRRAFVAHGEWMVRAYAIGLGAGTQVLTHLPWFLLVNHWPGEGPRAVFMGAGWVINVVVAERIIHTQRGRAEPSPSIRVTTSTAPRRSL